MGIRFVNNGKSGGQVSSIPNVFVQENEPTTKKGIWLQTNKELEHIYADDDIFIAGEWKPDEIYRSIPYVFSGSAVAIGTDIYLFGTSLNTSYNQYAYKYDTLTNTYTRLTNIPYGFQYGSAVAIGTDIYLLGGTSGTKYCYKYNTSTDTYTKLADIPYQFYQGSAVAIGTDIYLFGTGSSDYGYSKYACKYDTLTNTYTSLRTIPYELYSGSAVTVTGTNDIYLFGSYSTNYQQYAYKYDTLTDTYTKLTDIPCSFYYGSVVNIGNNIYLLGGAANKQTVNKYDIITNTYTNLSDIPYEYSSSSSSAVLINNNIYLIGGKQVSTKIQVYSSEDSIYENNSLVIAQGRYYQSGYGIELYNDTLFSTPMLYAFADAWFYTTEDGIITDIPTYYGNGTEWIKFKN